MSPVELDKILAKIDQAVGPPEEETMADHEARRLMVQRDHDARLIRRQHEAR